MEKFGPKFEPLTDEQKKAIREFARINGKHWKDMLRGEWQRASAGPVLHRLRNTHGGVWLAEFSLDSIKPLMGLRADVYTNSYRTTRIATSPGKDSGCVTVCGAVERVTLVGPEFPEVSEADADAPAVRLCTKRGVVRFEPVEAPQGFPVGPMMGGAFVSTSDSRFSDAVRCYAAIPLHDRYESTATYRALTND